MKVLIISDIHANYPALEAVWKQERDSDLILCLGDMVDWGPYPKEVLNWCRDHRALTVIGNHDLDVCRLYRASQAGAPLPVGTFASRNVEALDAADIEWLEALPESQTVEVDGAALHLKHYFTRDDDPHALLKRWIQHESKAAFDEIWPSEANAPIRAVVTGHTHQCYLFMVETGAFFLNPGSLSYRVCTDSHVKGAQYAVYQDGGFFLRHIDYDRSAFAPLLEKMDLRPDVRQTALYHLIADV